VVVSDQSSSSYTGFSFDPFGGMTDLAPAMKIYKDTLKIDKVFFGATDTRLVLTTSAALLIVDLPRQRMKLYPS